MLYLVYSSGIETYEGNFSGHCQELTHGGPGNDITVLVISMRGWIYFLQTSILHVCLPGMLTTCMYTPPMPTSETYKVDKSALESGIIT